MTIKPEDEKNYVLAVFKGDTKRVLFYINKHRMPINTRNALWHAYHNDKKEVFFTMMTHPFAGAVPLNQGLKWAAEKRWKKTVSYLVKHKSITQKTINEALLDSAEMGNEDICLLLIQHPKANINTADQYKKTPLYWALVHGMKRLQRALYKNPNLDVTIEPTARPLHKLHFSPEANKIHRDYVNHPRKFCKQMPVWTAHQTSVILSMVPVRELTV